MCGHCDKARASAPFFEGWAHEPGLGSLFSFTAHSDCLRDGQRPNQCLLPKPQQRGPSVLLTWLGVTSNTTRTESLSENKANAEDSKPKRGIKWAFWGREAPGLLCYISQWIFFSPLNQLELNLCNLYISESSWTQFGNFWLLFIPLANCFLLFLLLKCASFIC